MYGIFSCTLLLPIVAGSLCTRVFHREVLAGKTFPCSLNTKLFHSLRIDLFELMVSCVIQPCDGSMFVHPLSTNYEDLKHNKIYINYKILDFFEVKYQVRLFKYKILPSGNWSSFSLTFLRKMCAERIFSSSLLDG